MPRPYVQILEKDDALYVCTDCGTVVGVSPLDVALPPSQYDACPCTMRRAPEPTADEIAAAEAAGLTDPSGDTFVRDPQ